MLWTSQPQRRLVWFAVAAAGGGGCVIAALVTLIGDCQFARGAQQEAAVFGVAGAIEAEQCQFVTGELALRASALEQEFHRGAEGAGDAGEVAAQLAGAIGFPLGDGAAADIELGGQLILGKATGEAQAAYAGADCFGRGGRGGVWHDPILRQVGAV